MNRFPAFAIEKAMLMGRNPFYLAKIIDGKDSDAENDQNGTGDAIEYDGRGFIGKKRRHLREDQCADDTDDQRLGIRQPAYGQSD